MSPTDLSGVAAADPGAGRLVSLSTLLASAMAVSVFSIPSIGVLASFLIDDLGMSRSQLGWLVTSVSLTTAVSAPTAGRLVDRVGGRQVLLGVFALTASSAAAIALAPSYTALVPLAMLSGLPNGANNPATNKLIVTHVPVGRRGLVMGIKQSGVQAGIFAVSISLPVLAVAFGWRWAISTVAAAALLGVAVTPRIVPHDLDRRQADPEPPGGAAGHISGVRWLGGYAFLMGAGGSAITSFLPLYAQETIGFSAALAGVAAGGIALVGIGARIAIGHRIERVLRFAPPLGVISIGAACATLALLSATEGSPWLLWVGVWLAGLTVASWNAVAMLAVVAVSRIDQAGRATGLVVLGFMGGFTSSPVLFGWSVDQTGSYRSGWFGVVAVFVLAALLTQLWRRRDTDRPAASD